MAPKGQKRWLVVGLYEDNMQRWAEEISAVSPCEAEHKAVAKVQRQGQSLIVAAVLKGGQIVDFRCGLRPGKLFRPTPARLRKIGL